MHQFTSDNGLAYKEGVRIDHWWAGVTKTQKYPMLCRVTWAALTIFHGPKVESTFSIMSGILNPQCSRLKTSSVSAIQTVKYYIKASGKSAIDLMKRSKDDQVNPTLVHNMKMADRRRKRVLQEQKKKLEERRKELSVDTAKLIPKAQAVRDARDVAYRERLKHRKRARQAALEALRAKRSK